MKIRKTMLALAVGTCLCAAAETIQLPKPDADSGVTVTQALKARRSTRALSR